MGFLLFFVVWLSGAYWTHRAHKGMCRMGIFGEDPDFAVAANFLWPVLASLLLFEYLRYKHLAKIEWNTGRVAKCVQEGHHRHGDSTSLSTKHWND